MRIREAEPRDVPLVAGLIRELAEYERLLDQVTITEERLEAALFGDRRCAEVVLVEV